MGIKGGIYSRRATGLESSTYRRDTIQLDHCLAKDVDVVIGRFDFIQYKLKGTHYAHTGLFANDQSMELARLVLVKYAWLKV